MAIMSVWKVKVLDTCTRHIPLHRPKASPRTFSHDLHDELGAGCVRDGAAGAQAQELGDVGAHGKATWQGEVRGGKRQGVHEGKYHQKHAN